MGCIRSNLISISELSLLQLRFYRTLYYVTDSSTQNPTFTRHDKEIVASDLYRFLENPIFNDYSLGGYHNTYYKSLNDHIALYVHRKETVQKIKLFAKKIYG